MNLDQAPAYAHDSSSGIIYLGSPRQYRPDCKEGIFRVGGKQADPVGDTLTLQVVDWCWYTQQRFAYPEQPWLDVLGIDGDRVVANVSLKTESASNIFEAITQIKAKRFNPQAFKLKLTFAHRDTAEDEDGYYAVVADGSWTTPAEFQELLDFLEQGNALQFLGDLYGDLS